MSALEHVAIHTLDGRAYVYIDGKQVWPRKSWFKRLFGRWGS